MGKIFGTDGARGVANTELTCELAMKIGRAAAKVLTNIENHPKIIIGKDTRISSDMLESALAAGVCSVGADVVSLGVVPTPAVAYLVSKYEADAGVMISASHNSFEFNGIKIFSSTGNKLPDDVEAKIEELILNDEGITDGFAFEKIGRVSICETAAEDYINHVIKSTDVTFEGMEIAFDCSNGSSSKTAQSVFEKLGVKCHMLFDKPDGININNGCGSTHIEKLREYVLENKLAAGFAFDGDADRCLAIDENGELVDGDMVLAICALDMKARGVLKGDTIVGTIMSNLGLVKFCEKNGFNFVATNVGDRYVLEEMIKNGYNIGGEQSGHVIFKDFASTGDGEVTAVSVLSVMKRTGKALSQLASQMEKYPQVMINVKVSADGKARFFTDEKVQEALENAEKALGNDGRLLVRPSGTEPLLRVMTEGKNYDEIKKIAQDVADVLKERL